jgi:hypothetical protein
MKQVLVINETGKIAQIADEQFEVHGSLSWHTVPNTFEGEAGWTFNTGDKTTTDPDAAFRASPEGVRRKMVEDRSGAYGSVGDQLDAIYRDLRDGTTVFVDHISAVKAAIPKVAPVDIHDTDKVLGE